MPRGYYTPRGFMAALAPTMYENITQVSRTKNTRCVSDSSREGGCLAQGK